MRTFLLLLPLSACSDYDLTSHKDRSGRDDSGGGGPTTDTSNVDAPSACEPSEAPAIEVGLNDACDVELSEGTFTPVVEWEARGNNAYGPPIIANLDDDDGNGIIGNGDTPDILIVTNSGSGLVVYDGAAGTVKWTNRAPVDPLSQVAVGDVDGDGVPEIAASDGTGTVMLFDNVGNVLWRATVVNTWNGQTLYSALNPAIADMDGDGYAEIIAGSNILSYDGTLLGHGEYGVGSCPNEGYGLLEGSISVPVDLNGDGELEVVVGNAAYEMDGTALYTNGLDDGNVAIADFDLDPPAWWYLKKKTALYADAGVKGDFTRAIMQFTMGEPNGEKIRGWESDFRDNLAYLKSIQPPKYPLPIDAGLANEGRKVFEKTCAGCHGTYGPGGSYPNKVVPAEVVGTDSTQIGRAHV